MGDTWITPQFADGLFLVIATAIPAYAVLRFGLVGIVPGLMIHWVALAIAGPVLSALDPGRRGFNLDAIWLYFGWISGLIYCLLLYGLRTLIIGGWDRPRSVSIPSPGKGRTNSPRP